MNKDLIKKLQDKDYVRAFGLMLPEERECFKKVGHQNCMYYGNMEWTKCISDIAFCNWQTYAIKPDYQPKLCMERL